MFIVQQYDINIPKEVDWVPLARLLRDHKYRIELLGINKTLTLLFFKAVRTNDLDTVKILIKDQRVTAAEQHFDVILIACDIDSAEMLCVLQETGVYTATIKHLQYCRDLSKSKALDYLITCGIK